MLDTPPTSLESTTRKIRELCFAELQITAVHGYMLPDSRLRAILILAAGLIRLDIQELEGINSMVKVAVARSNNNRLTLPLLSARVGTRKVLALRSDSATTYKTLIPSAAALARSAYLYHGSHRALLEDTTRWETCRESRMVPGDPFVYNPSLRSTPEQLWAMKYNTQFMKRVRAHEKNNTHAKNCMLALHVLQVPNTPEPEDVNRPEEPEVWVCCAVSRSQAMLLQCLPAENNGLRMAGSETSFMMSVAVIASKYQQVEAAAKKKNSHVRICTQALQIAGANDPNSSELILRAADEMSFLCRLRARYQRTTESSVAAVSKDAARPAADDPELSGDDADDAEEPEIGNIDNIDNDAMMRLLMGWDDVTDDDETACEPRDEQNECMEDDEADEDKDVISSLDKLNLKLAIAAAASDGQSADELQILNDKVVDRCASADASRVSMLSPVEETTEAYLQEILLSNRRMRAGEQSTGSVASMPADSASNKQAASDKRVQNASSKVKDKFCSAWKASAMQSCKALAYRRECSGKALGDNSHMLLPL